MSESPGYPNVIAVRRDSDQVPQDLEMAEDTKALKVALYIFNTASLAWERMQQPIHEGGYSLINELLEGVLFELKKLNENIANITGTKISDGEIE